MDSSSDAAVGASVTAAYAQPDADGKFGEYGGRYVAETLMPVSYTHLTLPTTPYV